MKRTVGTCAFTVAAWLAALSGGVAQDAKDKAPAGEEAAGPRLRVRFLETRQRGDARTTVEACALALHAGDAQAFVFAGAQVTMRTTDKSTPTVTFKNAGVQAHLGARQLPDGRYRLDVRFETAAPLTPGAGEPAASSSNPILRVTRGESKLVLRDGETVPFATAVDPVTGEVVRVDVALDAPTAAKPAATGPADARLRAHFVVSRRHGDKTLASRPYSVVVQPGEEDPANVFSGAMLPLEVSHEGRPTVMLKDVGAGVRLSSRRVADGRYRLDVSVSDGTLAAAAGSPRVRAFQAESRLYLSEGERVVFASAVDPQTGDVVEAELTLEVAR